MEQWRLNAWHSVLGAFVEEDIELAKKTLRLLTDEFVYVVSPYIFGPLIGKTALSIPNRIEQLVMATRHFHRGFPSKSTEIGPAATLLHRHGVAYWLPEPGYKIATPTPVQHLEEIRYYASSLGVHYHPIFALIDFFEADVKSWSWRYDSVTVCHNDVHVENGIFVGCRSILLDLACVVCGPPSIDIGGVISHFGVAYRDLVLALFSARLELSLTVDFFATKRSLRRLCYLMNARAAGVAVADNSGQHYFALADISRRLNILN
jgi:hypothetical protein